MHYQKILVITLHRLGDNLQTTPLFKVLKGKYPCAEITVLTEKGFESVLEENPYIDCLKLFHRDRYSAEDFHSLEKIRKNLDPVIRELTAEPFDLAVNRHSSREGAVLAGLMSASERMGYTATEEGGFVIPDPWTRLLFAVVHRVKHNPFTIVEYNTRIAGGNVVPDTPWVKADRDEVREFLDSLELKEGEKLVAVQPGSSIASRRWAAGCFGNLCKSLLDDLPDCKIVLLGSPKEEMLVKEVEAIAGSSGRLYQSWFLALRQIPGLLSACDMLITNDTGPMNTAMTVGCPVLALFFSGSVINDAKPAGPGNIVIQADMDCIPCREPENCPHGMECKNRITPASVAALVKYRLGTQQIPDKSGYCGLRVYQANKNNQYHPLFKPEMNADDFMQVLYRSVFLQYLAGEEVSAEETAGSIKEHFTNPEMIVNHLEDLDITVLRKFCHAKEEFEELKGLVVQFVEAIRACF